MTQIIYHIVVFFLAIQLGWYILREKKFWNQLGAATVLVILLLRLFSVK